MRSGIPQKEVYRLKVAVAVAAGDMTESAAARLLGLDIVDVRGIVNEAKRFAELKLTEYLSINPPGPPCADCSG